MKEVNEIIGKLNKNLAEFGVDGEFMFTYTIPVSIKVGGREMKAECEFLWGENGPYVPDSEKDRIAKMAVEFANA